MTTETASDQAGTTVPNAVLLNEKDNVLICTRPITQGDIITDGTIRLTAGSDIMIGHKIAVTDLAAGDRILRYGAPIGSMTEDCASGGHVHVHNLKSDYIPSHNRQGRNS